MLALNALRSSWSRPFPQHPRAAGEGGGHRRWRCGHRACRRRGCRSCGPRWTPRRRWASAPYALVRAIPSGAGREAVLDLPVYYLSSCENSFIVLQVQGVFANALSVYTRQSQDAHTK